jgi:hypothetical protein
MPASASLAEVELNLDDLDTLVQKQTLGQLLALVELLPYKMFTCDKCGSAFRLESLSAKELVGSMLRSLQPVLPHTPTKNKPPPRPLSGGRPLVPPPQTPPPAPSPASPPPPEPPAGKDWESESLDGLFDYPVDRK